MTIPNPITIATLPLSRTYSGDPATSRFAHTKSDGTKLLVDIIQSLPNSKGRWRHVVRFSYTEAVDPITKVAPSFGATVSFDMVYNASPAAIASLLKDFLLGMDGLWDEVAAGEQ